MFGNPPKKTTESNVAKEKKWWAREPDGTRHTNGKKQNTFEEECRVRQDLPICIYDVSIYLSIYLSISIYAYAYIYIYGLQLSLESKRWYT